ncbi:hypothetical protein AGMMS49983_15510 [Clostridia bacterium]|nr:hypothetical protein AGMMS49983_15510 [Clostridia bacterium]
MMDDGTLRLMLDFANRPHKFFFAGIVGLFFVTDREVLVHYSMIEDALEYEHFLVYGGGHHDIWELEYYDEYGVDFDYYPRGRIAYDKESKHFLIFGDACIKSVMLMIADLIERSDCNAMVFVDQNYVCYQCNSNHSEV